MDKQKPNIYFIIGLLSFLPNSVYAHTGTGLLLDFAAGIIHPLLGVDHLLVMLAIGLWGGVLGGRLFWLLPMIFLSAMAAGVVLSLIGVMLSGAEFWLALSVLALGVILSIKRQLATVFVITLAIVFALVQGYVHAAEIGKDSNAGTYILGLFTTTTILQALSIYAGRFGREALNALRPVFAFICTVVGGVLLTGV